MMGKSRVQSSTNEGFTIIESLFVLAIAGIILSIVFLAIPALLRNSRNNQRRQDVQSILAAVSRWELNNSGNMPTTIQLDNQLKQYGKLTYYTPPTFLNITMSTSLNATDFIIITLPNTNLDRVRVYNHAKCDTSTGGATNAGAGFSDVVALYALESGSAASGHCQQL